MTCLSHRTPSASDGDYTLANLGIGHHNRDRPMPMFGFLSLVAPQDCICFIRTGADCAKVTLGAQSVLDTACGTGRGWLYPARKHPTLPMRGNDLALPLLQQAIQHGVPPSCFEIANSEALPYRDRTFDFVVELGALHHARIPETALSEMVRVARMGVALSDSNMYMTDFGKYTLLSNSLIGAAIKLVAIRSGQLRLLKKTVYRREYSSTEGMESFIRPKVYSSQPSPYDVWAQRYLSFHSRALGTLRRFHCWAPRTPS
jgi:ubiquinone/menaquinone biosynthesis C-methylase UbiE